MRFGISLPQLDATTFDATAFRDYLRRAEDLGFGSGWTIEQSPGPTPLLAPLELLAYAAACTVRMRLGVAVLVATLHDPIQLAASITTVDRLSHGRLDVGVSAGGKFRDFAAFGIDPDTFVARFTENLAVMTAAWSDEPEITLDGRFRTLDRVVIQPKPVQRPRPPVWFGAGAPRALARAVRLGDAFMGAGSTTTARFADQVRVVRAELDRQGRDPASFPIGKRVYLCVDDDAAHARDRALAGLHRIYGAMPGVEDVPVTGTPEQVADGLREVADAGAGLLLLNPLGADVTEDREQLERLGAEVIPGMV